MSRSLIIRGFRLSILVTVAATAAACLGQSADDTSSANDSTSPLSGACASAAPWTENVPYALGALVEYKGKAYRCALPHTSLSSWTPDVVPVLWQEDKDCAGPSDPGPTDPGPSDPGPSDPGPSDPGPSDPGPSDYSGTASYHAEYETGVTGAQVACAPNAFSVPDWETRFDPARLGYMVAALQATVYDSRGKSFVCNQCARVTAQRTGLSVTVRVIDRMTYSGSDQGKTRYLDLSPKAFKSLGGTEAEGVIPIDLAFVECPSSLK